MNNKNESIAIMSIHSKQAREIFDEVRFYDFRKLPLDKKLLNKKIYIYSAGIDKAIIGYVRVSKVLKGNTTDILRMTGHHQKNDRHDLTDYLGKYNQECYALKLCDATEFDEYLTLEDMINFLGDVKMPKYIKELTKDQPLYELIKKWDEAFSLDGNLCSDSLSAKKYILKK